MELRGALFKVNDVVSNAQPINDSGNLIRDIIVCTISNRARLWRSDTPSHYGVLGGMNCETISTLS